MCGLVHAPGGTLLSKEASCIVDHPCLIRLLSAYRAALPPRKPLKGLQTCSVENVGTRQQHLKRNSDTCSLKFVSYSNEEVSKAILGQLTESVAMSAEEAAECVLVFGVFCKCLGNLSFSILCTCDVCM